MDHEEILKNSLEAARLFSDRELLEAIYAELRLNNTLRTGVPGEPSLATFGVLPSWDNITLDENLATMSQADFDLLRVYGKNSFPNDSLKETMWKAFICGRWELRWHEVDPSDSSLIMPFKRREIKIK